MSVFCDVVFEHNPEKVVYTGQLLRGIVHLVLTEPKNVRGIFIRIVGEARVRWREGRNSCDSTGKQEYLNEKTYLIGGDRGEIELKAGDYHYTFQSDLPADLPSSFEGEYGHIRYRTCVVLDIPMWPDKEFEDPFSVIKTIDLNKNPSLTLREPVTGALDHTFFKYGFLICYRSNPLTMTARIPGGAGYVPGQTIYIELVVDNKSDQDVCAFTVQLISDVIYYTKTNGCFQKSKMETIILTETATYGCGINERKTFHPCLCVPQTSPGDDSSDNIIQVQHFCRIIGNVGLLHIDPVIKLPVVIGTIPLLDAPNTEPSTADEVIQNQPTKQRNENTFYGGPTASQAYYSNAPLLSQNQYSNDVPPKYEQIQ